MLRLVDGVDAALNAAASELPAGFPEKTWAAISGGARKQAAAFRNGLRALAVSTGR